MRQDGAHRRKTVQATNVQQLDLSGPLTRCLLDSNNIFRSIERWVNKVSRGVEDLSYEWPHTRTVTVLKNAGYKQVGKQSTEGAYAKNLGRMPRGTSFS